MSCSLCVSVRPWGAPVYTFRVEFLTSFEEAMGDAAITVGRQKEHLRLPTVRTQRPPVTEYDGLTRSPVLVIDFYLIDCVFLNKEYRSLVVEPCFHSRSALKKQGWHRDPASNTERVAQCGDLGGDFHGRQPGHGSRHSHGRRTDDCSLAVPRTRTWHGQ